MNGSTQKPVALVSRVTFRYTDAPGSPLVLEDVSLSIFPRDFVGLIGPNGGGKTTLIKILLGILQPQAGIVQVLGRPPQAVSRQIGYVPQHAHIDTRVPATVLDVVLTGCLGGSPWGCWYGKRHIEAAREAMTQVGVAHLADFTIRELSGGQRQRVLIARALAAEAKILLLDEPMAGVDMHMEQGILEILHHLNKRMPIVLVSHDLGFISAHVKRVACLNRHLVVNRLEEISQEVIAELYKSQGLVHQIRHGRQCPIGGEKKETGKEQA